MVTVVDAKHIWEHLNASEAQEQIAFADVLIINKKDLVSGQQLHNLEARIRRINAFAKIYHTENCDLSIEAVWELMPLTSKSLRPPFTLNSWRTAVTPMTSLSPRCRSSITAMLAARN